MARSLEQISQDLKSLETATARLNTDLKTLYQDYLSALGRAVRQQLVLATYHLCTQTYPEAFLKLSLAQREQLQAGIRKVAQQGYTQIEQLGHIVALENLSTPNERALFRRAVTDTADQTAEDADAQDDQGDLSETFDPEDTATEQITETTQAIEAIANSDELIVSDEPENSEAVSSSEMDPQATETSQESEALTEAAEIAQHLSSSLALLAAFSETPPSPISLAKRHVLLERHVRALLQTLSNLANYLLKQAQILPDLPEMVISAAAEAEMGETGPSMPNLLNVLVELGHGSTDDEEEDDDDDDEDDDSFEDDDPERMMTHLVAINLRIADIEFSDTTTALWRSRIQETLVKLKQLGSRYQKLQKENARATAEHAWRATWFDDRR